MTRIGIPNDYPVELIPPDITAYRAGNTGVDYVHRIDSGSTGPAVGITAVVHGNEPCGAIALAWLLDHDIRPVRGSLTLAFVNTEAYARFDPADPNATRWVDEDLNRVWAPEVLDGPRTSVELERARALRPVVEGIDLLLDIHSMQHPTEPLMLAGPLARGRELARAVGVPAVVVSDAGHAAGRRLRDNGGFADPASTKNALLVECGQHWGRGGAAGDRDGASLPSGDRRRGRRLRRHVSSRPARPAAAALHRGDRGGHHRDRAVRLRHPYRGLEVIEAADTRIATDGDRPVLTPYANCVLIMPSKRLWPGQTAVRLGRIVEG